MRQAVYRKVLSHFHSSRDQTMRSAYVTILREK